MCVPSVCFSIAETGKKIQRFLLRGQKGARAFRTKRGKPLRQPLACRRRFLFKCTLPGKVFSPFPVRNMPLTPKFWGCPFPRCHRAQAAWCPPWPLRLVTMPNGTGAAMATPLNVMFAYATPPPAGRSLSSTCLSLQPHAQVATHAQKAGAHGSIE